MVGVALNLEGLNWTSSTVSLWPLNTPLGAIELASERSDPPPPVVQDPLPPPAVGVPALEGYGSWMPVIWSSMLHCSTNLSLPVVITIPLWTELITTSPGTWQFLPVKFSGFDANAKRTSIELMKFQLRTRIPCAHSSKPACQTKQG